MTSMAAARDDLVVETDTTHPGARRPNDLVWNEEIGGYLFGVVGRRVTEQCGAETGSDMPADAVLIGILPMIFNHRVVLCRSTGFGYEAGWCYPDLESAVEACNRWDPQTEDEPSGYIKAALVPTRGFLRDMRAS